ncbi:MAG TPA: protein kinase [Clostridia bacterium]|nr:protein kinase [Clostridia bacterium]
MNKGQSINGYTITEDCSVSGLCRWSFAEKGGREYFIKEFLSPTYPLPEAPGSRVSKELRKKKCEEFEKHHRMLQSALKRKCSAGGNLVIAQDFFREKAKYYKVTEKVNVSSLSIKDVSSLPTDKKLLIAKTISHSLGILHSERIVHGDLKPDNILIKKTETGDYTAKLIDFDSSYFFGVPPEIAEDVVGDMVYYSPELAAYIKGDTDKSMLTGKSDIFALGLIFHQYFTGQLPVFDKEKYGYAYVAVNNSSVLRTSSVIPVVLKELLDDMLSRDPDRRPDINTVFSTLKSRSLLEEKTGAARKEAAVTTAYTGTLAKLLSKEDKKAGVETGITGIKPVSTEKSRSSCFKGTLARLIDKS